MFRKKSLSDELFLHFSSNVQNLTVFSSIYMIRIRFFGPGGFVYHDTNGLNHGPVWKIQSFLLSEISTVILWQDYCGKGNSRKFYWNTVGKSFQIGNAFVQREKGLFLSVYVDDFMLAGKKQNISPTWKLLMKDVDLGEPTSFFDHVYLGCTQKEC